LGADLPRTLDLPVSADGHGTFGWVARAHAVIEGAAKSAEHDGPFEVHRAAGEGDDAIVDLVRDLTSGPRRVVTVTADRGLRDRLPPGSLGVGPRAIRRGPPPPPGRARPGPPGPHERDRRVPADRRPRARAARGPPRRDGGRGGAPAPPRGAPA